MEDHREGTRQVSLRTEGVYHINSTLPPPICIGGLLVRLEDASRVYHKPVKNLEKGTVALRHWIVEFI